jgi:hypothetical protein
MNLSRNLLQISNKNQLIIHQRVNPTYIQCTPNVNQTRICIGYVSDTWCGMVWPNLDNINKTTTTRILNLKKIRAVVELEVKLKGG